MLCSCCERLDDGVLIFIEDGHIMLVKVHFSLSQGCQLTRFHGLHNVQESTGVLPLTHPFSWDRMLVRLFRSIFWAGGKGGGGGGLGSIKC